MRCLFLVLAGMGGAWAGDTLWATTQERTPLLETPIPRGARTLYTASNGESFPLLDTAGGWAQVQWQGRGVWAPRNHLELSRTRPSGLPWHLLGGGALLALGITLAALWRNRARPEEAWRRQWVLLAFPEDTQAPIEEWTALFTKRGWEVERLSDPWRTTETLQEMRPSLVVAHQPTFGAHITALETHSARMASTPVLFLDVRVVPEAQPLRAWLSGKPTPADILKTADKLMEARPGQRQLSRWTRVEGRLHPGAILDLLHFLESLKRTGCIDLQQGATQGWIWIENGQIRHCLMGKRKGMEALYLALDATQGNFSFRARVTSPEHSIHEPTLHLLHEYARSHDELSRFPT